MKVLILACLVALALAREKEEISVSSETSEAIDSQEFITHTNKKLQKAKNVVQQIEDELQDKVHPFIQSQPLACPFAQSIACTLPQNVVPSAAQPLAQSAVVPPFLPVLSPEIQEIIKAKLDTISAKHNQMPYLIPETFSSPIPSLTDLKNQHLAVSQLQSLVQQIPQVIPQTPMVIPQPQLALPQSKVLLLPQQVVPFPQRDMASQDLLQFLQLLLNPTNQFPATHPVEAVVV